LAAIRLLLISRQKHRRARDTEVFEQCSPSWLQGNALPIYSADDATKMYACSQQMKHTL